MTSDSLSTNGGLYRKNPPFRLLNAFEMRDRERNPVSVSMPPLSSPLSRMNGRVIALKITLNQALSVCTVCQPVKCNARAASDVELKADA